MTNRKLNSRGVSLVEVMISLVILLIVFMGLLQASMLSIDQNLRNVIRDEALRLASEEMNLAKSIPFDSLATLAAFDMTRSFRSLTQTYTLTRTVTGMGTTDKQITVNIAYTYRGETPSYNLTSLVRNK
jgi:prepilin-type N-terminal cleavage/methylation domain-containing protein